VTVSIRKIATAENGWEQVIAGNRIQQNKSFWPE
jgi:hypothetical protein